MPQTVKKTKKSHSPKRRTIRIKKLKGKLRIKKKIEVKKVSSGKRKSSPNKMAKIVLKKRKNLKIKKKPMNEALINLLGRVARGPEICHLVDAGIGVVGVLLHQCPEILSALGALEDFLRERLGFVHGASNILAG